MPYGHTRPDRVIIRSAGFTGGWAHTDGWTAALGVAPVKGKDKPVCCPDRRAHSSQLRLRVARHAELLTLDPWNRAIASPNVEERPHRQLLSRSDFGTLRASLPQIEQRSMAMTLMINPHASENDPPASSCVRNKPLLQAQGHLADKTSRCDCDRPRAKIDEV